MKKILILLAFMLLFTACDDLPRQCKAKGYDGILVLDQHILRSDSICSNGQITPDHKQYLSAEGAVSVDFYDYLPFDNNITQVTK